MAEYTIDASQSLKLNASNLTDERYADLLYRGFYAPGAARQVQLSLQRSCSDSCRGPTTMLLQLKNLRHRRNWRARAARRRCALAGWRGTAGGQAQGLKHNAAAQDSAQATEPQQLVLDAVRAIRCSFVRAAARIFNPLFNPAGVGGRPTARSARCCTSGMGAHRPLLHSCSGRPARVRRRRAAGA